MTLSMGNGGLSPNSIKRHFISQIEICPIEYIAKKLDIAQIIEIYTLTVENKQSCQIFSPEPSC